MSAPSDPPKRLADPVVLLFETSPFGTIDAIVQHDGQAVFFYLNESPDGSEAPPKFGTRACWVRNLELGPYVLNEAEMRKGISPMLPRTHCVHPKAQPIPDPENLEIIWLEEGNGAALIENLPDCPPTTLAIIPPWSGLEGFHGYASESAMESPICWPMPDNPRLQTRIDRAKEFWAQFAPENQANESDDETSEQTFSNGPFIQLQEEILAYYDDRFLTSDDTNPCDKKYFAIDGGKFPPRGMVQYQTEDSLVLATVGMSLCPQPAVEIFSENPQEQRRIELAIRIEGKEKVQSALESIGQRLSGLAGYPWKNFSWLGAGHTCDFSNVIPGYAGALLTAEPSEVDGTDNQPAGGLPDFRDDPVTLLWLVPKTEEEMKEFMA
ncbi:MAG: suppressor of fused domain protein [Mariniblastus sp.]